MLTAVIVDDESKSIKNLEYMIEHHCPEIKIIGTASNALEAIKLILKEAPDVIFLDVQMPGYTGFDVLDQLSEVDSKVIFTTAHKEYAIDALRKGAFDYLLKPIDPDDLRKCVNRVIEKTKNRLAAYPAHVELAVKGGIIFIKPNEIIRLEAAGSYTTLYLDHGIKHLASKSMKEYERQLDPALFYRCHNSHVVNLSKVVKFISDNGFFAEMKDGSLAEIAKKNKEDFLFHLKECRFL